LANEHNLLSFSNHHSVWANHNPSAIEFISGPVNGFESINRVDCLTISLIFFKVNWYTSQVFIFVSTYQHISNMTITRRVRGNSWQINRLFEFFERCPRPTRAQVHSLSVELEMPIKSIRIWFQNHRSKQGSHYITRNSHSSHQSDPIASPSQDYISIMPRGNGSSPTLSEYGDIPYTPENLPIPPERDLNCMKLSFILCSSSGSPSPAHR
jgi:hypothetical protein